MSQGTPKLYIPTGTTPELVIQSLNDFCGIELSTPGAWSPTLFYKDLKEFPAVSKKSLAELINKANQIEQKGSVPRMGYLQFFERSRGSPRPNVTEFQRQVCETFEEGSVMLYFEPIFLRLFSATELTEADKIIIMYIKALSEVPVVKWNEILEGLGACCYQFFGKEPELYAKLIFRTTHDQPEDMTDQELLEGIGSRLSPTQYRGRISIDDSRSALLKRHKETVGKN